METTGEFRTREGTRARILAAAAAVFAEHGVHGATTRLIAERADVNEVTVFRIFGSKDAVLGEAVRAGVAHGAVTPLPASPGDVAHELTAWCAAEIARLREARQLFRQCFSVPRAHAPLRHAAIAVLYGGADELISYVARLHSEGRISPSADLSAAQAMFMATLLSDALARDEMSSLYPPAAEAPSRYVALFLSVIGYSSSR